MNDSNKFINQPEQHDRHSYNTIGQNYKERRGGINRRDGGKSWDKDKDDKKQKEYVDYDDPSI